MALSVKTDIQQRFADADILGHVNNISLQAYFDLGKMRFYDQVLDGRLDWRGLNLVLVSIHTEIMHQTRLGDSISVETFVEKIGTKSITVMQRLINNTDGTVNALCRSVAVGFDYVTQQSVAIPDEWRRRLAPYVTE